VVDARVHTAVTTANAPRDHADQLPLALLVLESEWTARVTLAWTSKVANITGADLLLGVDAHAVLGLAALLGENGVEALHLLGVERAADSASTPASNPACLAGMLVNWLRGRWHADGTDEVGVRHRAVHLDERNVVAELSRVPLLVIDQVLEATRDDPRLLESAVVNAEQDGVASHRAAEAVSSRDDPLGVDQRATAKVSSVVVQRDLPRPIARQSLFTANDSVRQIGPNAAILVIPVLSMNSN